MLLGRDTACAALEDWLASVGRGAGGGLVVAGPAGIGKTALLDVAAERAANLRVIRVEGTPAEMHIPYAGLSRVLLPLVDQLPSLASQHRSALASALALGPPTGAEPLSVSMGCINLLAATAEDRPVVVLVDDAHWIDEVSRDTLGFAARRLTRDPVGILAAFRTGPDLPEPPPGLPVVRLAGLDADACRLLLEQRGHHLGSDLAYWLHHATQGNPLAICDLPRFATAAELSVLAISSGPAPIGPRLESAYGRAFQSLPDGSRRATLVVAVLDDADVRVVSRALGLIELTVHDLAPAEDAGLLSLVDGQVRMRHPLVRAAIVQLALPSWRRDAHRAAAEGLLASGGPRHVEARVWHLAEAAVGIEESTAALLEDLGEQAVGRAGYAAACVTYAKAAELSEGEHRVRRLVAAASAAFSGGQSTRCRELLRAATEDMSASTESDEAISQLQAQVDTWSADPAGAARQLQRQAQRISAVDPMLGIRLAVDATAAAGLSGQLRLASELAESVSALTRAVGPALEPVGDLLVGSVQAMRGDGVLALTRLDRCRSAVGLAEPSPDLVAQLVYLATAYHFIDAFDAAMPLFDRAIDLARQYGAVGILPFALAHSANSRYRLGDWDGGYAEASEALSLAEDSGRIVDRPIALVMLGQIEAARGDARALERSQEAIEGGEALGARFVIAQGFSIAGLLQLGLGRAQAAVDTLQRCGDLAVELGLMELGYLQWAAELVEARILSGAGDAAEPVRVMREATHSGTTALNRALLARSEALIAADESSEEAFAMALRFHEASGSRPFERARTQLCFGERLRRGRRRRDARTQLTAAWETFSQLGATCWAERAWRELQATGGTRRTPAMNHAGLLTPQEFQVARAAAVGSTNREIADALFLSQKTVEFHLSAVYRRLGLRSRAELAAVLTGDEELRDLRGARE